MVDETTDTDEAEYDDAEAAFVALTNYSGQSYLTADDAWYILGEFHEAVEYDFIQENHPYANQIDSPEEVEDEDGPMALSMALKKTQRASTQARGMVSTWPHEVIVTAADVSEMLVEALGGEPSEASYAGAGSTADARHEENIETLRTLLDDYRAKAGEAPAA